MNGLLGHDRTDCEFMKGLHGHERTGREFMNVTGQTVSTEVGTTARGGGIRCRTSRGGGSAEEAATSGSTGAEFWIGEASGTDSWTGEASGVQCAAHTLKMATAITGSTVDNGMLAGLECVEAVRLESVESTGTPAIRTVIIKLLDV